MWDKQCSHVEVKQINICESVSTKRTAFESAEASYVNEDAQNFKKSVTQELFAAKALVTAKPSEKNLNDGKHQREAAHCPGHSTALRSTKFARLGQKFLSAFTHICA